MDDNTRRALANLTTAVASLVDAVSVLAYPNPALDQNIMIDPLIVAATRAVAVAQATQD